MSTMLTELVQHLQDVHTHHLNDDGRVIVAVPTTPHTMIQAFGGRGKSVEPVMSIWQPERPRRG